MKLQERVHAVRRRAMVRSASAMSMPPVYDTWPMPPPYGPRRLGSSVSMICIARTCRPRARGLPASLHTGLANCHLCRETQRRTLLTFSVQHPEWLRAHMAGLIRIGD